MVVTVSVTIGYDVPWRQVHALLLTGAANTPGIRKTPAARVLQRELSDFYVQYQLLAHLEEDASRALVLSDLHGQIQDAFNEHGVQIMSPHFMAQPNKPVFVPKAQWHAAPAMEVTNMAAVSSAKPDVDAVPITPHATKSENL